jgi:hypothetical protein
MARAGLGRIVAELRTRPSRAEVDEALARLRVRRSEGDARIERAGSDGAGVRLEELRDREAATVHLARGVYASVPTADGRVALLRAARRGARESVELHVVVTDESSHLGRAVIDAPRRLLRLTGVPAAEPGDRFGPESFAHCFFDEEALVGEIARAGLVVASRSGFTFVLRDADVARGEGSPEHAESFAVEVARVLRAVRSVDEGRKNEPPRRLLAATRARGAIARARGPIGRARLRRAIGWVDALLPGGASCYRRILLEIALDAGAARETVVFGLDVGSTGHVAFEGREERRFDVSFAIPADGEPEREPGPK